MAQHSQRGDIREMIDAILDREREVERMTTATLPKRLGFFTHLLDQADPAERYRLATAQIIHAERYASIRPGSPRTTSTKTRAASRSRLSSWPRSPPRRRGSAWGRES